MVLHDVVQDLIDTFMLDGLAGLKNSVAPSVTMFCSLKFCCVESSSPKYTLFLANHGLFRKLLCV